MSDGSVAASEVDALYRGDEPERDPEGDTGIWEIDARTTVGVLAGSPAKILVPGNIMVENYIITTDSIMNGGSYSDDPELHGFMAGDPDNNPDTVETGDLAAEGYRGEGMRGGEATSRGEAAAAVRFEGGTSLARSTMGIGYLDLITQHEGYSTNAKLFFNYSDISAEPVLRVTQGDVFQGPHEHRYKTENPIGYSEDENNSLLDKFGWDPTLGSVEGGYTSKIKDAFDRSTNKITEALITTYPIKLATFPRTPPMKIRRKDIAEISDTEAAEGAAPTGTTAIESVTVSTQAGETTTVTGGGLGGGGGTSYS